MTSVLVARPAGQRGEHLADRPVHLRDEIAVVARLAAALEFGGGHDGVMRRGEREIEEEGLGRCALAVLDVAHRAAA